MILLLLGCNKSHGSLNYETIHKTPLYQACNRGDLETVKNLINEKNINSKKFELALHYACDKRDGNLDVVKYLVETCQLDTASTPWSEYDASYGWRFDEMYHTPLFYAFKKGNCDIVSYLVSKMKINSFGFEKSTKNQRQQAREMILNLTPLNRIRENIEALLENENIEELRRFIGEKIKLKEFVEEYNSKIQKLTSDSWLNGLQLSPIDYLCQDYLSITYFDRGFDWLEELLPLEIACKKTSLRLFRFLIEEQSFEPQHKGIFLLHHLIQFHHCAESADCMLLECIKYLVEICHVDPMKTAWGKSTVLHTICETSHMCSSSTCEAIDYFIKKGISIDVQNESGNTPLHNAVNANNFEVVKYLVEKYNAMINVKNEKGVTPLFMAGMWPPNINLIHYLITHGAKPDITQEHRGNFLHYACRSGNLELAKMLVDEFGMDIYATVDGETALEISKAEAERPYFDPCEHESKIDFEVERKKYSKIVEYLESKNQIK